MRLNYKVLSGVKWTSLSAVIAVILQFTQITILARLLLPKDFGLMAIVMMIIGFAQTFMDMGISNAIIYKQDITQKQLSSLYWCNIFAGFLLFLLVGALAPFIASWYGEPELFSLIVLVSFSFLIQPIGQQFSVLWQKELRFDEIAVIEIINKVVVFVVSILLAYLGFGIYSLVYGLLTGTVIQTLQYVIRGIKEHPVSLYCKPTEIGGVLSFGLFQMGEKTVNYFHSQIDTLLIGKLFGMEILGGYNIAKQLIMKPIQIVNPISTKVSFPVMSMVQNDLDKLKSIYLKQVNVIASVNFPIYVFLYVMATHIITVLYGEKWLHIVEVVQVLCVYGALRSIGNPVGSLLLSKGRADLGFYWNLSLLFYIPVMIYLISPLGIIALSWGLVFVMLSLIIPMWYFFVRKLCGAGFMEYHRQIVIPAIISLILCVFLLFVKRYLNINGSFIQVISLGSVWLILIIILNYLLNNELMYILKKSFNYTKK